MGDKVVMNGACTCPGNKEEQTPDYICGCPADMVDDGTGTDNCVPGKCNYFLAKAKFFMIIVYCLK